MSQSTLVMKAVLRKDFLQLWPIVALAAALLCLRNILFPLLTLPMSGLRTAIEVANGLACCTLLFAVIQQDALTGVRHDWFTRPISRGSLFAAKAIFIVVTLTVPADLSMIIGWLVTGHSLQESLAYGLQFSLNWVGPLLMLAALGTLSNTLLKAAMTVLAVIAFAALLVPVTLTLGLDNDAIYGTGIGWITESFYLLLLMAASAGVLWLQYAQRKLWRSIAVVTVATVLAVCAPMYITQRQVFGVQKLFSSAAKEQRIGATLAPGCFSSSDDVNESDAAFTTRLQVSVPPDSHLFIGATRLRYIDGEGRTLLKAGYTGDRTPVGGSRTEVDHWRLPRAVYDDFVARRVHAQVTYSMSLLEPTLSADLVADGSRRYLNGIGFCSARPLDIDPSRLWVDCLKRGTQPAQVSLTVKGDSEGGHSDRPVDFRPSWLEFLTVQRWQLGIAKPERSGVPTVTLTAFEARAHVDRTFTIPGVLGGEQCVP